MYTDISLITPPLQEGPVAGSIRMGNPAIGRGTKAKPNPLLLLVAHSYDVCSLFNPNVGFTQPTLQARCSLCYLPLAGGQVAGCP
jgi:hypothetical protein